MLNTVSGGSGLCDSMTGFGRTVAIGIRDAGAEPQHGWRHTQAREFDGEDFYRAGYGASREEFLSSG